ncbi:hypothetical protein SEUCBS139899_005895 [Sporothrix eucalyptigena]|uniref:AB hydrolase-1 domain-containing protein n=1 Tax=Sporothrix eucalyptigena TaxID=1812306 RepID=A0ABP0AX75_9PEZI
MFALDTHSPQILSVDGLKIWAAQAGRSPTEAPTIVFIPGFASSSLLFDHQFRDEELLSKYCLITYEPRGQGRSEAPTDDAQWSSLRFAQDFEAVCHHYGASKVFVAGWSAACAMSSDIFEHNLQHLVAGLIYLAGMPYLELLGPVNLPTVAKYYHPLMGATTGDTHGSAISDFVDICVWKPNRANMSYTFRSALVGTIASTPTTTRTKSMREHHQDPTNLLKEAPNFASIFIVGDEEEVVTPDGMISKYKEILPDVQVVRVPGAGHTVFWERPVETKKAIVDFIERVTN